MMEVKIPRYLDRGRHSRHATSNKIKVDPVIQPIQTQTEEAFVKLTLE